MTVLLIALFLAVTGLIVFALADSGFRMWSAIGGLRQQLDATGANGSALPQLRGSGVPRVTARISFARPSALPQRAAA